jgi:nitric oxide reductase subunit B
MNYKRLWIALAIVLIASFGVLGGVGYKGIKSAPPIPQKLVTTDGQIVFAGATVMDGQNVWQSLGGQEIGSIWGHGAYVAPDWTADYLHRECEIILDRWAQEKGAANYAALSVESQAALRARLQELMRRNTYDAATGTITIDPAQAAAYKRHGRMAWHPAEAWQPVVLARLAGI